MKSKRVTKLLACVLASSMCTMPVFASGANATEKSFDISVGVESTTVNVTVPTQMNIKVNPFADDGTATVSQSRIASDEFVVQNTTSYNGTGIALMCTATAQITGKADDVKINYHSFASDADSNVKRAYMKLVSANTPVLSRNNVYADANSAPVTTIKSQLQVPVAAPNGSTAGLGAFALIGTANTNAGWKAGDLKANMSYKIDIAGGASVKAMPSIPDISIVSTNISNNETVLASSNVLTAAVMGDAKILGVHFHSPENDFTDITILGTETDRLNINYTPDSGDPSKAACDIKMPKNEKALVYLTSNLLGKDIDIVIALTDGRRLLAKATIS